MGVIVGVLLKAGFDIWTERSRRRREDHLRFTDQKQTAYETFLTLVDDLDQILTLASDAAGIISRHEAGELPTLGPAQLQQLRFQTESATPKVLSILPDLQKQAVRLTLLAPPEVEAVAQELQRVAFFAHAHAAPESERLRLTELRQAFRAAARRDLGVDSQSRRSGG